MKEKLLELIKNSYEPYTNTHFACIVEGESGRLYEGVNVNNASFAADRCAESNAICYAISQGERKFKALYLMTDLDEICYPCGVCKQIFTEFFDENVIFNLMNTKGEMKVLTYDEVMKNYFTKENMK